MRMFSLLALCALSLAGCPSSSSDFAECRSAQDCAEATAPCAGCPAIGEQLCRDGVCAPRTADAVEVSGDVNIDRGVAPRVASFVHVLAADETAEGPFSCEAAFAGGRLVDAVNVLSAGFKAVSGGSFHEGVSFGRAPEVPVAVVVIATSENAGQGDALATGCLEPVLPVGPTLDVGLLQVRP